MATMSFRVPDRVKKRFDREFAGENKSRVIVPLMIRAIEERSLRGTRARAIDALLKRRRARKPVSAKRPRAARKAGRP